VLHADYLIEGTIQHDADVVRVAARLVDASKGAHREDVQEELEATGGM
jgi:TolB-like protein